MEILLQCHTDLAPHLQSMSREEATKQINEHQVYPERKFEFSHEIEIVDKIYRVKLTYPREFSFTFCHVCRDMIFPGSLKRCSVCQLPLGCSKGNNFGWESSQLSTKKKKKEHHVASKLAKRHIST